MPLSERDQYNYVRDFLWRKYSGDLVGLKSYADQVSQSALDEVILTSTSFEGGRDEGQVKFNKFIVFAACEDLIKSMDPAWTPPPLQKPSVEIAKTVWLGS